MLHGTTGSSSAPSFTNPLLYRDDDEDPDHGDCDPPLGSRPDLPCIFREVVALITDYFPAAKPASSSSTDLSLWFDDFGNPRCREPHVLSLFDTLAPLKREVEEKFAKRLMTRRRPSRLCPSGVTCTTLVI